VHACSRVDAVRHIPWSLYLAVGNTACCTNPCAARNNTKPGDGSKQVQLYSLPQRSGIDVCAYGLDPSNRCCRLYLAVMACCTNPVHTAVFRTACRQRLLTNRVVNLLVHVCTYACLRVDAVKHTQQAVPGCVGFAQTLCRQ
jgi:hypothetical protein